MTKLLNPEVTFAYLIATEMIITIALAVLAVWLVRLLWPRRDEINYRSDRIRPNIWRPK